MLFNSLEFLFVFLPITYAVFWLLPGASARYVWLTISGYVFYGWWDPRFCLLMAFSTLVSYTAGRGMLLHAPGSPTRRLYLVVPIVVDLALLAFFKYAGFGLETIRDVAGLLGVNVAVPTLEIVLPIGISFYTFHTISYIVDAYRGTITPTKNFWEFASYVSLFSQLVAGPIVRFRQIEEDLEAIGTSSRTRWIGAGLSLFCVGLTEKVLLADTIAALVDPSFARWQELSTGGAWMATIGYSLQLLFDFSGYSTMAVGLGLLFAIRIPWNFNSPYQALDPSDFWQRWHISLSSCLRDYVYIPLGGNRGGEVGTYRNLMATMLIGGLWHGASWTFVFWGFYHGLLLTVHRRFRAAWDPLPAVLRQALMVFFVMIGWVFFRATTFEMALGMLHRMFVPTGGTLFHETNLLVAAVAMTIAAVWSLRGPSPLSLDREVTPRRALVLAALFGVALGQIVTARPSPFLYFQF